MNKKISDVEAIEDEDWSASYEEHDLAIGRIEGEINKLSKSLDDKPIFLKIVPKSHLSSMMIFFSSCKSISTT